MYSKVDPDPSRWSVVTCLVVKWSARVVRRMPHAAYVKSAVGIVKSEPPIYYPGRPASRNIKEQLYGDHVVSTVRSTAHIYTQVVTVD